MPVDSLESLIPPEAVAAYDVPLGSVAYPTRDAALRGAMARMIRAWPGMETRQEKPAFDGIETVRIILPVPDPDAIAARAALEEFNEKGGIKLADLKEKLDPKP